MPLAMWDVVEKGLSWAGASPSHLEPDVSWQEQSSPRGLEEAGCAIWRIRKVPGDIKYRLRQDLGIQPPWVF